MAGLTYEKAGVDIGAEDALIERIKPLAARTRIPEVLLDVGGFAGLCSVPAGIKDPVLVSGTDGVGTKLAVAIELDVHDTIGIDLVAMCVNDVVTTGARPLFFLDYFATGALDVDRAAAVVAGVAQGCEQAGCALIGGETAELPGFYEGGKYDLAGFSVGVIERHAILGEQKVRDGDALLGVASNGLHANGYSLARAALLGRAEFGLAEHCEPLGETIGEALLRPTKIYASAVAAAVTCGGVHAICHVTGGGLAGNLVRVLPPGLGAEIDLEPVRAAPIFDVIRGAGDIAPDEMARTFNMGVGLVFIVERSRVDAVTHAVGEAGDTAWHIGEVTPHAGAHTSRVRDKQAGR